MAAREDGTNVPHEKLSQEIVVQQPGYAYIYFSNDNEQPLEVFFDDFTVTHSHSAIVQADDYYPFGLTFNGYRREDGVMNRYLYHSKELSLETGSYDFHARMYDPALGRTFQIDPHSENYFSLSGYSWVDNNPLVNMDPTGMDIQYGKGLLGGDLYTGEDMVKMLLSLQAQFRELNDGREKEKDKEKERKKEEARAEVDQNGGGGVNNSLETASDFNNYIGGIVGIFDQGFKVGVKGIKSVPLTPTAIKGHKQLLNVAKGVGRIGMVGNIASVGISATQFARNPTAEGFVNFGVDIAILGTAAIPYVGPILSIGLGAYNADGGFDSFKKNAAGYIKGIK